MKTLVLGASENQERYSNKAIKSLLNYGHEVLAIGNKSGKVLGVKIETELQPFTDIDTITLYLNPTHQQVYYDYIISLNPNRVIFNPGTENPELYKLLAKNNIKYELACTLVLLATHQF